MEVIFEIVFYVLAELVLTVIGETLFELGFHSLAEAPSSRVSRRVIVGLLYAIAGIVLGALSLKLFRCLCWATAPSVSRISSSRPSSLGSRCAR
jgi:hypothetical protein